MNHTGTEIPSAIMDICDEPLSSVAKYNGRELASMLGRIMPETSRVGVAAFQASI